MNYDKMHALAVRLIGETGREARVVKLGNAPTDPSQPWNGPGEQVVIDSAVVTGTFVPAGAGLGLDFVDEELLKRAEQVALIAPTGPEVDKFHALEDSGTVWKIEWVEVLRPANLTLLYIVGVKR